MAITKVTRTLLSTGIVDNSNATAITIDSSENVGIGTSPAAPLHVVGSSLIGVNDFGSYDKDDANLLISNGNNGTSILLHDGSGVYHSGLIKYDTNVLSLGLNNSNSENSILTSSAINITSTGVGIGTTPVAHYTGYRALDIGTALSLFSNSGSTNVATLTNNGYLNSGASQWTYKVTDEATMYSQVHGDHRFSTAASGSAGAAITWSEKVRIQAAGGISFNGDTAAANALDDYEEGTWTPACGATLSTAIGKYTKIGNQVTVHYHIVSTGGLPSSGGQVIITGLPFTSVSGSLSAAPIYARYYTPNDSTLTSLVQDSETQIRLININETSFDYTIWGELEATANNSIFIIGTATYQV